MIYVLLSAIWKPTESMILRAILPDEVYEGEEAAAVTIEGKEVSEDDVERSAGGKKTWKEEEDELRVV